MSTNHFLGFVSGRVVCLLCGDPGLDMVEDRRAAYQQPLCAEALVFPAGRLEPALRSPLAARGKGRWMEHAQDPRYFDP